jgi:glycosyltransferase involved in cell wall biosynthesis
MKVSIVIPVYNSMLYFPETLESALQQTFDDFEVIIVNDGSTDEIETWVKEQTDPRLTLISQDNQGASKARNTGILHSTGDYIAFLDADDLWAPTKLAAQVEFLDNHPQVGLVYTWVLSIDASGNSRGRIFKNSAEGKIWDTLILHNVLECGSTPLVRRECFDQVGMFDESLTNIEDRDMWLRIAKDYDFAVVKEPLVYYRLHPNSKGKNWPRVERNASILLEKAFQEPPSYLGPAQLESLKKKGYAMAYLRLAWKPLKAKIKDRQASILLKRKAAQYWPFVRVQKDYLRLSISLGLMGLLGDKLHERLMEFFNSIRGKIAA